MMSRDQYDLVGPWPRIAYYADVWLSEVARMHGIETRMVYSYQFVHHWSQVGRLDDDKTLAWAHSQYKKLMRVEHGRVTHN